MAAGTLIYEVSTDNVLGLMYTDCPTIGEITCWICGYNTGKAAGTEAGKSAMAAEIRALLRIAL